MSITGQLKSYLNVYIIWVSWKQHSVELFYWKCSPLSNLYSATIFYQFFKINWSRSNKDIPSWQIPSFTYCSVYNGWYLRESIFVAILVDLSQLTSFPFLHTYIPWTYFCCLGSIWDNMDIHISDSSDSLLRSHDVWNTYNRVCR